MWLINQIFITVFMLLGWSFLYDCMPYYTHMQVINWNKWIVFLFFRVREGSHKNADDVLFDMFKNEDTGLLPVGKFLAVSTA